MTTEADDRATYEIALYRWRADVLEYAAALAGTVGLADVVAEKTQAAADFDAQADALEAYQAAFATHGRGSAEFAAAADTLAAVRREIRTRRAAVGQPLYDASIQTNYSEPTAAELLGS